MPTTSSSSISRRRFNRAVLAGAGALCVAPAFLRGQNLNSKLNIAIIGAGGRGGSNMGEVASENIVALCDVNTKALDAAGVKFPNARQFTDFRKLFDRPRDFDAVVVSTCEHTHAFATMLALQNGKHVYCEKPLTHNVWEARQIREAAGKTKLATQMGTQGHASENFRRVYELVAANAVGPVREVHVWVSRAWGLQSEEAAKRNKDIVYVTERPNEAKPPPDSLKWDLWVGPAPSRPFNDVYVPGPKWYRWWDFGNGTMSDLGSHWNNLPFWALKLKAPLTIEAIGPEPHPELAPASMSVAYEFGARGEMPPVKLTWHQGESKPEIWKAGGIPKWPDGMVFIGDKGMILSDYGKHTLLPEERFKDYQRPAQTIPKSIGHHAEWILACKTGSATLSNFEYAGWLTESNHLGNVAHRAGQKLVWDPEKLRATNTSAADPFIRRTYREGWAL